MESEVRTSPARRWTSTWPRVGETFDRYVLEEVVGEGGAGRVYRAFDPRLRRHVALKVLRAVPGDDPGGTVPEMLREARSAAALDHPNATGIFDVGEFEGAAFIVMELVTGTSLRRRIGDPDVPLDERVRWLLDVAGALSAAHDQGIVHRDVKPENVMVRDDGLVKVLDFGVAQRAALDLEPSAERSAAGRISFKGTPAYMSPEQMCDAQVDARADQFAWGVLAYEVLTGQLPWRRARDVIGFIASVMSEEPEPLRTIVPEIPPALDAAIRRALAKAPADRFETLNDAAAAIAPYARATRGSLPNFGLVADGEGRATLLPPPVPVPDDAMVSAPTLRVETSSTAVDAVIASARRSSTPGGPDHQSTLPVLVIPGDARSSRSDVGPPISALPAAPSPRPARVRRRSVLAGFGAVLAVLGLLAGAHRLGAGPTSPSHTASSPVTGPSLITSLPPAEAPSPSISVAIRAPAEGAQVKLRGRVHPLPYVADIRRGQEPELVEITAPGREGRRYWVVFDRDRRLAAPLGPGEGAIDATAGETAAALGEP